MVTKIRGGMLCLDMSYACGAFVLMVVTAVLLCPHSAFGEPADARSQFRQFLETKPTDAASRFSNAYFEMYYERVSTKADSKDLQLSAISMGKDHSLVRLVEGLTKPLAISEEAWRRELPLEDASTGRIIGVVNPRYLALVRAKAKPNTLDSIRALSHPDEMFFRDPVFPIGIPQLQRTFKTLTSDPNVRFEEFGSVSSDGKQWVRVVFVSDRTEVERLVPWKFEAFLDPERGHMQRLIGHNLENRKKEQWDAEYDLGTAGAPRLHALRMKFWDNGDLVATGRTLFRNYKHLEFPDNSRFYLPHYDIPEPAEFAKGRGIPWGWWLVALGVGFVVVSLILRRFRGKA